MKARKPAPDDHVSLIKVISSADNKRVCEASGRTKSASKKKKKAQTEDDSRSSRDMVVRAGAGELDVDVSV